MSKHSWSRIRLYENGLYFRKMGKVFCVCDRQVFLLFLLLHLFFLFGRKITPEYLDIGWSCPKIKEVFLDG